KRRTGMKWPGRSRAPISIRCGTPTIAEITSRVPLRSLRGRAQHCNHETSFQQDLNGDGSIGLRTNVIESIGSTSLEQVGSNYLLHPNGGSAVELSFDGAPVVAGQFDPFGGPWELIGAEQTASGYDVAWKVIGADQFEVWTTDQNGNFASTSGIVSG